MGDVKLDTSPGDVCANAAPEGYLGLPVAADDLTIGRYLEQVASRHGDREALVSEGRHYTYAQLLAETRAFAKGLLACGVAKGSKAALLLGNRAEFVIAAHGAAMAGAVLVPVSTMATPDERDYILAHSDAALLVVQPELLKRRFVDELVDCYPAIADGEPGRILVDALPHLRRVVSTTPSHHLGIDAWADVVGAGEAVSDELLDRAVAAADPSDDGMIIYTSGTTAHPKAVVHRHRGPVVQSWRWADQLRVRPDERVWSPFPFFWTAGWAMVLGGTLSGGACLVCQDAFEPGEALELMERERVTTVHSFPPPEAAIVDHPDARRRDLSSLRRLSPMSQLRKLVDIPDMSWGPQAAFGLSETFTIATSIPSDSPLELRQTTHGVALPGMEVRIVDPMTGERMPVGEQGEIALRGVTLMRGYAKVPPEECFDDEGWFHTLDAGHLDEQGYLHWAGRLSGVIKTGGANVAPAEVDAALQAWNRLKTISVIGLPHPTLSEAVVLCTVSRGDVTAEEIVEHLRTVLAPYKVPRRVLFFGDDQITYTGTHKVRVNEIRTLAARRIAAGNDEWAAFLRERHADLLQPPEPDTSAQGTEA